MSCLVVLKNKDKCHICMFTPKYLFMLISSKKETCFFYPVFPFTFILLCFPSNFYKRYHLFTFSSHLSGSNISIFGSVLFFLETQILLALCNFLENCLNQILSSCNFRLQYPFTSTSFNHLK